MTSGSVTVGWVVQLILLLTNITIFSFLVHRLRQVKISIRSINVLSIICCIFFVLITGLGFIKYVLYNTLIESNTFLLVKLCHDTAMAIARILLYALIAVRLYYSFKGTIFAVSKCSLWYFSIFISTQVLINVINFAALLVGLLPLYELSVICDYLNEITFCAITTRMFITRITTILKDQYKNHQHDAGKDFASDTSSAKISMDEHINNNSQVQEVPESPADYKTVDSGLLSAGVRSLILFLTIFTSYTIVVIEILVVGYTTVPELVIGDIFLGLDSVINCFGILFYFEFSSYLYDSVCSYLHKRVQLSFKNRVESKMESSKTGSTNVIYTGK
jgi:hypothetical protein